MIKRRILFKASILVVFLSFIFFICIKNRVHSEVESGKFEHNGIIRDYVYYSPSDLPGDAPLVVVLHGFTDNAENMMKFSKMNILAKENNFAVVYPQGTKDKQSRTFWNVGYSFHSGIDTDDADFIAKLVRYLQIKHSLSVRNTFLTGMSNGGEMCFLLACKYPGVFRAAAPVAGTMLLSFFDNCNADNPIPLFAVFGTNDKITNYNGDINNNDGWGAYQSIPFIKNYWAKSINYTSVEIDTLPDIIKSDSSFIVREKYLNTQNGKEMLFYNIINGGHDWPGAWGNMDINVSKEIWAFFEKAKQ
jgi:polyhydroxybutyrate depolymerase